MDLALNNLQCLMCHKTKQNLTKPNLTHAHTHTHTHTHTHRYIERECVRERKRESEREGTEREMKIETDRHLG